VVDDTKVREFFDALERAVGAGAPAESDNPLGGFRHFRILAEYRERHGRERFGQSFLQKENIAEGFEEAADLAIYPLLDSIKEYVRPSEDPDVDLVLTAARHAFIAFEALRELAGKRRGSP